MRLRSAVLKLIDRFDPTPMGVAGRSLGLSGDGIDIDHNGVTDFVLPPHPLVFWTQELAFLVPFVLLTQLASAAVFSELVQPELSYWDAVYHCLVSATTVGFGDVTLTEQPARLWAVVHILFSTSWLAALVSHVNTLSTERRSLLQRADLLQRQLDPALVDSLDKDGEGVDKLEFVIGMLVTLGVEVCGEPLTWSQVRPFLTKFDQLDVSRNGRLTKDDLAYMVERNCRSCKVHARGRAAGAGATR